MNEPNIKIDGLKLWIHCRQFPDAQDYWDGNWLSATAICEAHNATVKVTGSVLMNVDIARWMKKCEQLHRNEISEANLEPLEPNLKITIRSVDKRGHLEVVVEITPEHMTQRHRFTFGIDQSYLPRLISECHAILKEHPIRQPEKFIDA
ncbi:MAG TPA: hypothetical protein VMJ32_08980 [Pirellulales bacterium]|nr:hypothetical protein [Pirellulales bacterium]